MESRTPRAQSAVWMNTDADKDTIWREIVLAVHVQVNVGLANCLEDDMELWHWWVLLQLLERGCLGIINELSHSQYHCAHEDSNVGLTWSTPKDFASSRRFPDAETVTVHPIALASCVAYKPTAVLPPLMKTFWPGSSLATSNRA